MFDCIGAGGSGTAKQESSPGASGSGDLDFCQESSEDAVNCKDNELHTCIENFTKNINRDLDLPDYIGV